MNLTQITSILRDETFAEKLGITLYSGSPLHTRQGPANPPGAHSRVCAAATKVCAAKLSPRTAERGRAESRQNAEGHVQSHNVTVACDLLREMPLSIKRNFVPLHSHVRGTLNVSTRSECSPSPAAHH